MTQDHGIDRRTAITALGAGALGIAATTSASSGVSAAGGHVFLTANELGYDADGHTYVLPDLPYAYDALEPVIDEQTMRIHHDKHHAGYVRGLNRALTNLAAIRNGTGDASLIKHWSRELAFHGSGHANHSLFWMTMTAPGSGAEPSAALAEIINRSFGSIAKMKMHFAAAAKAVEGSGWGWLAYEPASGTLQVLQGEKQQNMLTTGVLPLLGIDVWEHAYYLNYQNRRGDYVDAWFDVVNWSVVSRLFNRMTG